TCPKSLTNAPFAHAPGDELNQQLSAVPRDASLLGLDYTAWTVWPPCGRGVHNGLSFPLLTKARGMLLELAMDQQAEKKEEAAPAAAQEPAAAAGPAPAAPAAAAPPKVDEKKVAGAVDALEAELGARFYTNDKKVTEALRGKSKDEIEAIRKQYKDKTGKDMD